jgi:D-threo-aldose 1-dehydrogenase
MPTSEAEAAIAAAPSRSGRRLGREGPEVTALGFGGAPLGELYERLQESRADATLAAAWDAGIRYFDTAPHYGRGLSELRIGRLLRQKRRDGFTLSTKVGRVLAAPATGMAGDRGRWAGGLDRVQRFDYGRSGIMRSFEDSLQRLGLARVDVLYVHDLDTGVHGGAEATDAHVRDLMRDGWRTLEELRRTGAVSAIGLGINEPDMIRRILELVSPDCLMLPMSYTLIDQSALDGILDRCDAKRVAVVVAAPFASGILATGPVPGAFHNYRAAESVVLDRVARIATVCERHRVPLAAAALQFPLLHPAVVSIVPGVASPEEVESNRRHIGVTIPADLWRELKAEGLMRTDAPAGS